MPAFRKGPHADATLKQHEACALLPVIATAFSSGEADGTARAHLASPAAFWCSLLLKPRSSVLDHRNSRRHLSVTEGRERSSRKNARSILVPQFRLTEWIVPPVIVPLLLVLVVLAVAVLQG